MRLSVLLLFFVTSHSFAANYYVDASGGTDTAGQGTTDGTAYATIQFAIDDVGTTHGAAADGDQINIKDNATHSLSGELTVSTYTTSTTVALKLRGYTTTANDGGQATIQGSGTASLVDSAVSYIHWIDLELDGNNSNVDWADFGNYSTVHRCKIHNASAILCRVRGGGMVSNCEIFDGNNQGVRLEGSAATAVGCYIYNGGTKDFTVAIYQNTTYSMAFNNIISIDGSTDGIRMASLCRAYNNSILCAGGTGAGISIAVHNAHVFNNLIEGFSGAGGIGVEKVSSNAVVQMANNSYYDNTTDSNVTIIALDENNESLGSSPFSKSGTNDFANRLTYFAPNDVGNVVGGSSINGGDRGAVQSAGGGGGGVQGPHKQTGP